MLGSGSRCYGSRPVSWCLIATSRVCSCWASVMSSNRSRGSCFYFCTSWHGSLFWWKFYFYADEQTFFILHFCTFHILFSATFAPSKCENDPSHVLVLASWSWERQVELFHLVCLHLVRDASSFRRNGAGACCEKNETHQNKNLVPCSGWSRAHVMGAVGSRVFRCAHTHTHTHIHIYTRMSEISCPEEFNTSTGR